MKATLLLAPALAAMFVGSLWGANDYIGDEVCAICHAGIYGDYIQSGHPWKLHYTGGETPAPDEWPHSPVPRCPTP